jgi:hypothetical protein
MKWIALVAFVGLAACATPPDDLTKPIVIDSKPIERPALSLPPVDKYNALPVQWIVVTPENVEQIFSEMRSKGQAPALFALTENGYENISINTQQALRVIMQQQAIIDGYQQYYVRVDRNIQTHNNAINTR